MKYLGSLLALTVLNVTLMSQSARASSHEDSIRVRMMDRLTEVVELKIQGVLVEGVDGYLHLAPSKQMSGSVKRLMTMENIDRKEVYRTIGLKATPMMDAAEVGKMRFQMRK